MARENIVIIFEGVDKSGKTTLKNEFHKATNYAFVSIDRLTVSGKAYSYVFNRGDHDYLSSVEKAFVKAMPTLCVLCVADPSVIKRRMIDTNEQIPDKLQDIARTQLLFKSFFDDSSYEHKLVLDTGELSVEQCIDSIKNKIDEISKNEWEKMMKGKD